MCYNLSDEKRCNQKENRKISDLAVRRRGFSHAEIIKSHRKRDNFCVETVKFCHCCQGADGRNGQVRSQVLFTQRLRRIFQCGDHSQIRANRIHNSSLRSCHGKRNTQSLQQRRRNKMGERHLRRHEKCVGILCEAVASRNSANIDRIVMGIGINLFEPKCGYDDEIKDIVGVVGEKSRTFQTKSSQQRSTTYGICSNISTNDKSQKSTRSCLCL